MIVNKTILCDLTGHQIRVVEVSRDDVLSRTVCCRLIADGEPWAVPEGAGVSVAYTLPDGTPGRYATLPDGSPAATVDGSAVTIRLSDRITAQAGPSDVRVVLTKDNAQLATFPFRVRAIAGPAMMEPEELPPVGGDFAGALLYGDPAGKLAPLPLGEGLKIEDGRLNSTGGGSGGGSAPDLSGYATEEWVQANYHPKGDYIAREELSGAVDEALAEAKKSGVFDGAPGNDGITPHIGGNGNWYIGNADTGVKAQGVKGDTGKGIKSIARTSGNGAAGSLDTYTITYTDGSTSTYQVRNGSNGAPGKDGSPGADGISPHIGSNGNWYVGTTNTGVRAQGPKGDTGAVGPQGPAYALTDADKAAITAAVIEGLPKYAGEVEAV